MLLFIGHYFVQISLDIPNLSQMGLFLVVSFRNFRSISNFKHFFCVFLKENICLPMISGKNAIIVHEDLHSYVFYFLKNISLEKKFVPKQCQFWLMSLSIILARYIHYTCISKIK